MEKNIDIKKLLPHRYPMLMVDSLQSLTQEHTVTSFKIMADGIFVQDGVLNEVGLMENAAQTCSMIQGQEYFSESETENNQKVIGFISSIKSFHIHRRPLVGEILRTESCLVTKFEADTYSICTMKGQTFVNKELIANFTINLFIEMLKK